MKPKTPEEDYVIYRHALQDKIGVTSETIRRWLRAGKLPEPDVYMSYRVMGWRRSTLEAAGVRVL
jgi:hypothetical protein